MTPIEKALLTWYKPDNPLYKNHEHPTIKLAGEIGELIDLYGKHKYKPGFDWTTCKVCKCSKEQHFEDVSPYACKKYTPIVLDELGDIWYYLRILAWIYNIELNSYISILLDQLSQIKLMYCAASDILISPTNIPSGLNEIYSNLLGTLATFNTTIEELTELNYIKLNSDSTNHGWKDAR